MGTSKWIAGLVAVLGWSAAAFAQPMEIQYAEPVSFAAAPGASQFDAYGRRFSLELSGNERALSQLPAARKQQLKGIRLLRGKLAGIQKSWVRLTTFSGGIEGVIWDGQDLYSLTTYGRIAPSLSHKLAVPTSQTVVYRLSDTLNALPREYCATETSAGGLPANNGLAQYQKLTAELRDAGVYAAAMNSQLEIALVGDTRFQMVHGQDAIAQMLARFNVAEGIYGEQLQLLLVASDVRIVGSPDPFTATAASSLLDQLKLYRRNTPAVGMRAVAHLITGKDLDGDTAGIAVLGKVCELDGGISLSEGWRGATIGGLVMAHELGHNFGAGHDGEGACATTPHTYLMAPTVNGSSMLSQCSLEAIRPVLERASCLSNAVYARVELAPAEAPVTVENDTPTAFGFTIRSTGTIAANNVRLHVVAPNSMLLISVTPSAGCSIAGNELNCDIGIFDAGEERHFDIVALPSREGSFDVDAGVSAANGQGTLGGSAEQRVIVERNVEGAITISASPIRLVKGDAIAVEVVVESQRSHALENARVSLFGGGMTFGSVSGDASCTVSGNQAICQLGQVDGNSQQTFTLHGQATAVGDLPISAQLYADNDPYGVNNASNVTVHVDARRDVAIEVPSTASQVLELGDSYELTAIVRSLGVDPVDGVIFGLGASLQSGASPPQSVTVGGQACPATSTYFFQCTLGTLAAGEAREVVIRGRADAIGAYLFHYNVSAPQQDYNGNDSTSRGLVVRHPVDIRVSTTNASGIESREFSGFVQLESLGINTVTSELTLELPPQVRVVRANTGLGDCALPDAQHVQCTFNFSQAGDSRFLTWFGISDEPGTYAVKAAVSTPGDGDDSNDHSQSSLAIAALQDIRVDSFTAPRFVLVGRDYTLPATVVVGSRAVTGARAWMDAPSGFAMSSMTSSRGNCARMSATRFECALGDLPGGATVNVMATVSAASVASTFVYVVAEASGDNDVSNNSRNALVQAVEEGDVAVTAAAAEATGTAGQSFSFPRITLRRSGPAVDAHLELTLPSFVTVNSVSGVGSCTGTTTLQCDLPFSSQEFQPVEVDLSLAAEAPGSFTSSVRVTSANDTNAANDETSVAITVNAAPPPPPPSSVNTGGQSSNTGGGGGSFEWLSLGLLAALVRRRPRKKLKI